MSAYYDSMKRRASEPGGSGARGPGAAAGPGSTAAAADVRPDANADFAALREHLTGLGNGSPLRTLVFTGCSGAEAVGTFVRDFGRSLAQGGLRVLVVETGRAPAIEDGDVDLASAVAGAVQPVAAVCGRGELAVVGSRTSPAEKDDLLRSVAVQQWLAARRAEFDYVLVATPPILKFADGILIGRSADGVVLVVQAEGTERAAVGRAREQLDRSGLRLLGAVLDGVRDDLPAPLRRYLSEG